MTRTAQRARLDAAADRAARERAQTDRFVDWDALNRLSAYARMRRAEMGEDRWNQLKAEWPE